jgi:type I restriction enzyme, S subunit
VTRSTAEQWPVVPLGSLAEFKNGINYTKESFGQGIKVINVKDFQDHSTVKREALDEINPDGVVREKDLLQEGDIVFVRSNGNRALIGRSLLITKLSENVTHSAFSIRARLTSKSAIPQFYAYVFRSALIRQALSAHGSGTNINNLNQDILTRLPVPFPPLHDQQNVVAVLSGYDDLIENNTRRIQVLEQMAQALYREWFVHFRFPGHAKVKLVESPLGKIPQGWKPGVLGDVAGEVRRGVNPGEVEPDTPYIGLEHMPRKSIALSEWGTAKQVQSTKLAFKKGEILFGKIRPYFHKVGVAAVDGVCSTDAIVIVTKSSDYFALVLECVSSEDFVNHATQTSQGTKMPRANWDVLVKYPLLLPPAALLSRFSDFIHDTVGLIQNLVFKNRNLRRTRDLLLPKLISGALDVSKPGIEGA